MQDIYIFIPLTLVIIFVLIIVAVLHAVGKNSRKLRVKNSSKEIEDRLQTLEARMKHLEEKNS